MEAKTLPVETLWGRRAGVRPIGKLFSSSQEVWAQSFPWHCPDYDTLPHPQRKSASLALKYSMKTEFCEKVGGGSKSDVILYAGKNPGLRRRCVQDTLTLCFHLCERVWDPRKRETLKFWESEVTQLMCRGYGVGRQSLVQEVANTVWVTLPLPFILFPFCLSSCGVSVHTSKLYLFSLCFPHFFASAFDFVCFYYLQMTHIYFKTIHFTWNTQNVFMKTFSI